MASINLHVPAIQQRLALPAMRQAVCRAITDVRRYPYTNVAVADQFSRHIAWPLADISGRRVQFDQPAFCKEVFEGKIDPDNLGRNSSGDFEVGLFSGQIDEIRSVNTAFSVVGTVIREMLADQDKGFIDGVSENLTFLSLMRLVRDTSFWLKKIGDDTYPDAGAHEHSIDAILAAANMAFQGVGIRQ